MTLPVRHLVVLAMPAWMTDAIQARRLPPRIGGQVQGSASGCCQL